MILSGLCSVTFTQHTADDVISAAASNGLHGIEWHGKTHVPHGNLSCARDVQRKTEDAGLRVTSYGSYYRAGVSEDNGLSFTDVLETAVALRAPTVRVWAADRDFADATPAFIEHVVADTLRIAEMASQAGLTISFEYHGGSFTNSPESTQAFAAAVDHPAIKFYWQAPLGAAHTTCLQSLEPLLPRLSNLHVFHWKKEGDDGLTRRPLQDGAALWRDYLRLAADTHRDHWALLEFVRDDSFESLRTDAAALNRIIRETAR